MRAWGTKALITLMGAEGVISILGNNLALSSKGEYTQSTWDNNVILNYITQRKSHRHVLM